MADMIDIFLLIFCVLAVWNLCYNLVLILNTNAKHFE